jgi:type I restriction enzyme S subunit
MTVSVYPEYKYSGVVWMGDIPAHWRLRPLKHLAKFVGGGTPSREEPEYWGGDIPWVSPKDMKREVISTAEEAITEAGLANSTSTLVPAGAVLMVVRSGILKHTIPVATNSVPVALNQDMKALRFHPEVCLAPYFLRWVQGFNHQLLLAWGKQGATVESIEQEYLGQTVLPLPPVPEQTAIASFLDRETGKIDALVEQQRRLIELLKEKRQSLISHAVTKGLDPTAKMKPSGVDWLGEVPEHWEVTQIKRACSTITDGAHVSPETNGGVFPFISTRDVDAGRIDFEQCLLTSEPSYQALVRSGCQPSYGDVLFSKDGTIGQTAVVRDRREFVVASSLIIIRPDTSMLDADFLDYLCQSSTVAGQVEALVKGAGLPRLSIQNLLKVVGVIPPLEEQRTIVAALHRTVGNADSLVAEATEAVRLLQERRAALISAAVTGKIDVRTSTAAMVAT